MLTAQARMPVTDFESALIKCLIRQFPDPPQRIAGRNPLLNQDVGKQETVTILSNSHLI
jgi:hypothetical protein